MRQHDSHDLLRYLLDKLDTEELVSVRNSNSSNCGDGEAAEGNIDECSNQRNNATLVDLVFQGQLCSTIFCSKCGYHSVTYEPFYDLSLSLPSKPEDMKVSLPSQNDPSSSKTQLKNDEALLLNLFLVFLVVVSLLFLVKQWFILSVMGLK